MFSIHQLQLDGIWLWWTLIVERYTHFAQASRIGPGTDLYSRALRGDNSLHAKIRILAILLNPATGGVAD